VVWAASTINFVLPHLAPGDPLDYLFAGEAANTLSEESRARLAVDYGVQGSLIEQYGRYWAGLAQGDLGTSLGHSQPVTQVLISRLGWTLALAGISGALSAVIGIGAGVAASRRRGARRDVALVAGVLALDAMPGFWIAMILVAVFSVELGWLPSFGAVPLSAADGGLVWLSEVAQRLVLPVATLVLATLGGTFLVARASMVATLGTPYILMAEAKGVPARRVAHHHGLRNALLPVTTHVTMELGMLVSGAVVVETVFNYPGLGRLVYDAVIERDYPLLQGAFLLLTLGVVAANVAADLLYPRLDPRVRRTVMAEARA
jgi:peptide/nickel transport system permease protein